VIREDRELLTELARLNTAMASLAMRMIDGSDSAAEQQDYGQRLVAAGERLRKRANETAIAVVEGEVLEHEPLALPSASGVSYD
jgi:hypothetical protein